MFQSEQDYAIKQCKKYGLWMVSGYDPITGDKIFLYDGTHKDVYITLASKEHYDNEPLRLALLNGCDTTGIMFWIKHNTPERR